MIIKVVFFLFGVSVVPRRKLLDALFHGESFRVYFCYLASKNCKICLLPIGFVENTKNNFFVSVKRIPQYFSQSYTYNAVQHNIADQFFDHQSPMIDVVKRYEFRKHICMQREMYTRSAMRGFFLKKIQFEIFNFIHSHKFRNDWKFRIEIRKRSNNTV